MADNTQIGKPVPASKVSGAKNAAGQAHECTGCPEYERAIGRGAVSPQGSAVFDECLGRSLESLSAAFSASARRWELIVYPSLVAFIILAAYGFYLIYSLTKDVHMVSGNMGAITESMDNVALNMSNVAVRMDSISAHMVSINEGMDRQVEASNRMVQYMQNMSGQMNSMTSSMHAMNVSMDQMRMHAGVMNQSISRPMSFMNTFMPW